MDLSKDIEIYGREIIDFLSGAEFEAILAAIDLEKNDGIKLEKFRSRKYGWANVEAETPSLYVMGLGEEVVKADETYRRLRFKYSVEVYVGGADPEELERITNRYSRAIQQRLLKKYSAEGDVTGVTYTPSLKFDDSLFKVCQISFQLNVFQDIT